MHSASVLIQEKVNTTKQQKPPRPDIDPFSLKSWAHPSGAGQDGVSHRKPVFLMDSSWKLWPTKEKTTWGTWKVNNCSQMVNENYVKAESTLVPGVSFVGFVFFPLPLSFDPRADGITERCSRPWQQSLQAKPLFLTRGLGEGCFAGEYRGLPILSVSFVSLFSPSPPKPSPN